MEGWRTNRWGLGALVQGYEEWVALGPLGPRHIAMHENKGVAASHMILAVYQ